MAEPFLLKIVTPEKAFYSGRVSSMVAPGNIGSFGILPNHAPLIACSNGGRLKINEADQSGDRFFKIGSGIIEVLNNQVTILTKDAEAIS
ncbi:MAG: ATP synthase F1 subunit epsilon [Omnitrophica bacterium RIFCSPLOWO2_12_FULL_44_17]|uniref:ATP synthase F1 subunit epsilon n=1 Tax=Candidatus Danuiimicrobium aquiferis TaxID=1801832 RepID=A0A1G1KWW8_9BACT|nr:MAG: ATP synthase F1 subunit epsilon [Omnitrophica bacterium RIFCSPHIGHO2_02_FULL_45_28]OGW89622.1 MAG: ATP synthase F1 subunit epsilon [Omnitrophica bacterium RIFCSPHIGHO2_12_FULL_44_12]OGW97428.1 MAG: ATP synthase F1 subunit epsilon [Omnitrophica bacterium RIFCSPLOWO2_12_FULL_44_17]OGX04502.1 MAG: ATP synthase F1 subunit epsilon [Omnitrophica bacterium RIFCSPLOWO2_02_FULL_44_11]